MPALSNPTLWRTAPHRAKQYLFLLKPTVVFQAQVNQSTFTYPLAQFNWNNAVAGAYTDVLADMTVLVGTTAGSDDLGRQRVRKAPTSSVFYIGWASQGDRDGEVALADDRWITVLDLFQVWSKTPYYSGAVQYKDYDIAAASYGTNLFPVANGGPARFAFVDPATNQATLSFSGANSYHPASATMTHAWDFGDGSPASSAVQNPGNVTFPLGSGFRYVHYTVTDQYGTARTHHIPVVTRTRDGEYAPITDFEITAHTVRPEGQSLSVRVYEDIDAADYPDGTLALIAEEEWFGDTQADLAGPAGAMNVRFVGWHQSDPAQLTATREGLRRETTLDLVDVLGKLDELPGFPQLVEHATTPDDWAEMKNPSLDKYLAYLLDLHSTALGVADYLPSITEPTGYTSNYPFSILSSDGASLYAQVEERADAAGHHLTCNMQGQIMVRPDPQVQQTGERTSTVIVDLVEDDWEELRTEHNRAPRVHWLHGSAIRAHVESPASFFCIAPGEAPGQGVRAVTRGKQLAYTQVELNYRAGGQYARLNAPEGDYVFDLTHGGYAGIDPGYMEWIRATVSAAFAAQRGWTFTNARFLPKEVRYTYNPKTRQKKQTVTAERELFPYPAQTRVIDPNLDMPEYDQPTAIWGGEIQTPQVLRLVNNLAAFTTGGLYLTSDFLSAPPTFAQTTLASLGVSGTTLDFLVSAFSPGYLYGAGTINGHLITTYGIYWLADVLGSVVATLQHTFPYSTAAYLTRTCDASFSQNGHAVVISNYAYEAGADYRGTWVAYTTDGVNWTEFRLNSYNKLAGGYEIGRAPGLYVSSKTPGLVLFGGFSAGNNTHRPTGALYRSTAHGASPAEATDLPVDFLYGNGAGLHVPYHLNAGQDLLYYLRYYVNADGGPGTPSTMLGRTKDGATSTSASPTEYVSGPNITYTFGPVKSRWGMGASPTNRNRMALAGLGLRAYPGGDPRVGVYVTEDAGVSWTRITTLTNSFNNYTRVAVVDDDTIFLWGGQGANQAKLAVTTDFGATVLDKKGNIGTLGGQEIIAICGGAS